MQSRAALIFLLSFLLLLRAASAHSWASVGAPLTVPALGAAILLAGVLAGAWYAYQAARRPTAVPRRHGHLMVAR